MNALFASLALLTLGSQDPPAANPAVPKSARWVIHTSDGRVHRSLAREVDGGFEIRQERDWKLVASADVTRARRESDLLAQLEARRIEARRPAGEPDPATSADAHLVGRVDVARWALTEGLLEESIAELDGILALDPDLAAARELVARAPLALTLPTTVERTLAARLVLFGARAKPAYRELAASRLATLPREEALAELARGLPSPSPSVRAFSAFALRRLDAKAQADALVRRAVLDPSAPVRLEAARALRDANDETLARRVAAALELDDARARTNAAESLGEMGYDDLAVPALAARLAAISNAAPSSGSPQGGTRAHIKVGNVVAYVQDYNLEIAQGASIADPIVNLVEEATVLDVRVGGISTQRVDVELPTLCRALVKLTGEHLPIGLKPWLDWWEHNKQRYGGGAGSGSTGG